MPNASVETNTHSQQRGTAFPPSASLGNTADWQGLTWAQTVEITGVESSISSQHLPFRGLFTARTRRFDGPARLD